MKSRTILSVIFGVLAVGPALAESNVWRTGEGFVIRLVDIDRNSAPGRALLLHRVEHAANVLCRDVRPKVRRNACMARTVAKAEAGAPVTIGRALQLARSERGEQNMASR